MSTSNGRQQQKETHQATSLKHNHGKSSTKQGNLPKIYVCTVSRCFDTCKSFAYDTEN